MVIKIIISNGMKVIILGTDKSILDENSDLSKRLQAYRALVDRLTVVVPESKSKVLSLVKMFLRAGEIIKKDHYDVISVQDPYHIALVGLVLAKIYGVGLNVQVHGWEKFYGIRKFIAKYVLPRADSVRAVSRRIEKELVEKFGVESGKITTVPIFTDLRIKNYDLRIKNNSEKFIFLTVSRLVAVKNIGLQIEAMEEIVKRYPTTELWIVGEGSERKNLESMIKELGLENNVKLLGWQNDTGKFYEQADAFLLTSDSEGWGLVAIEAASYGLPIIMTDVGCAGEVIEDGKNGLVIAVGDTKQLAQQMARVIGDEKLRRVLGGGAYEAVKKLPSQQKTLELYKENWERAVKHK